MKIKQGTHAKTTKRIPFSIDIYIRFIRALTDTLPTLFKNNHILSGTVTTRSNLSWYYTQHCDDCSKT